MLTSTLLLLVVRPRIVLKPSRLPTSTAFDTAYRVKARAVWVDGKDTGVRIPAWEPGFFAVYERSNRRGDLGGEFSEEYRGAMNGTYHHLFAKLRNSRFALLTSPGTGRNPAFAGFDSRGRLLAVDDPPMTNLSEITHAYLWQGSKWVDLGVASTARFAPDGSIVGAFSSDRQGNPLTPLDYGGDGWRVRFQWKNGKRTEWRPYQA